MDLNFISFIVEATSSVNCGEAVNAIYSDFTEVVDNICHEFLKAR